MDHFRPKPPNPTRSDYEQSAEQLRQKRFKEFQAALKEATHLRQVVNALAKDISVPVHANKNGELGVFQQELMRLNSNITPENVDRASQLLIALGNYIDIMTKYPEDDQQHQSAKELFERDKDALKQMGISLYEGVGASKE